jgi:stage III sporulation protein AG
MKLFESAFSGVHNKFFTNLTKNGVMNTRFIVLGILGILLLIFGGMIDSPTGNLKSSNQQTETKTNVQVVNNRTYEELQEIKWANLLSQIKGAGSVAVSITYESSSIQEHAKNITKENRVIQEKDTSGGVRTTTETKENEQILVNKENGIDHPVIIREIKPVIKGVMIIADGAYDSNVKANLTRAVEAGLGIPSYKITVLPQRK